MIRRIGRMYRRIFAAALLLAAASCSSDDDASGEIPDLKFRDEMRSFVREISAYAKLQKPGFLIIPQNGQEILTVNSEPDGPLASDYIQAIDAVGREDLFYGYTDDDVATPAADRDFMLDFCDIALNNGKPVLVTDYCSTESKMDDSYTLNAQRNYVSFAANVRELSNIPDYPAVIHGENSQSITQIGNVKNFLYLINPSAFASKQEFLDAVKATNYDLILIDLYYDNEPLTASEVQSLRVKANGGSRLAICYMSIGEAEDYRYYWNSMGDDLIYRENPDWPGNFVVKYWEPGWKAIIYGNDQSYTRKIIDAGFDGVYLDIIEAYESFE